MMTTQAPDAPQVTPKSQHAAFFRQSGWLMLATVVGGALTLGVHPLAKKISGSQYSEFVSLLMLTVCLPTTPLQMIFAQQTAQALATGRERQIPRLTRQVCLAIFMLWAVSAAVVFWFQNQIVAAWQLSSPMALWVTLGVILVWLWTPIFTGLLQGKQDFMWMGWSAILSGVMRLGVAVVLVLAFACGAAGIMAGALSGIAIGLIIVVWQSRDLWRGASEPYDVKMVLRQMVPLLFGFGACQFMFTTDILFAKPHFTGDEMAYYGAAGTLSRGVMWLVMPLAAVMFPKLVHSHAKSEKTNLFGLVVLGTAVLAICGGLGLWLVGPFVVKQVFTGDYVATATRLLPWYAGAMVPLAMSNVMVNDLLARGKFRVVPFMVLLAIAYGFTLPFVLNHYPKKLEHVLQTLAVFNFLLLCVCACATFGDRKPAAGGPKPAA